VAEDRITAALRGPVQPPQPAMQPQAAEPPSGSAATGYATPDLGPFECENCIYFQAPGTCSNPQVVSDPEVQGQVDPEACCNLFTSAHNETQAEEHGSGEESESEET